MVHSMHFPCRVILYCGIGNMALSHLSLLNNIFKKQILIKFSICKACKYKKKTKTCRVCRVGFYMSELLFPCAQKCQTDHNYKRSTGQRLSSSCTQCKNYNNCMNKSQVTLQGAQHVKKKMSAIKTPLLFSPLLFISVSRHLRARGQCESEYQRDHCSLGLALGKYSTATKR